MIKWLISGDIKELEQLTAGISAAKPALEKASASATNKTAVSARVFMARFVADNYRVKIGAVKREIKIRKAAPKWGRIDAKIYGSGSPGIPLDQFAPTPKRAPSTRRTKGGGYTPPGGIKVEVRRGRRKRLRGGFLSRMGSGHIGVFRRSAKKQLPIKYLYGPSPVKIIAENDELDDELENFIQETQDKNIAHEANYFLRKAGVLPGFR